MYLFSVLKIALVAIQANKGRTLLTTLGIIIGISAVIAMLSVGQGAQQTILAEVQGLGSNVITVLPVGNFSGFRTQNDLRALDVARLDRRILPILDNPVGFPEIAAVAPEISQSYSVSYRSNSDFVSVYGITADYFDVREVNVARGRRISEDDDRRLRQVTVIGSATAETLFAGSDALGKQIKIGGSNYTVVGIAEEKGSGFDDRLYVPFNTAARVLIGQRDFGQIYIKVRSEQLVDPAAIKVEQTLRKFYRTPEGQDTNFTVYTSQDVLTLAASITGIFTTLLASIAGISLLVGGIGIMNIMLVSVTERTREIGLRKAVGAKQGAILSQFLLESVLLSIIGGIIGIIVGTIFGLVIGRLGNIPVVLSWQSIALATSVSFTIGVVFGYYPAYRAARLNPIDALRYE